jgi:hypothetical protein
LGVGKTLTLTYLAWNNWFHKNRKIYSNYDLYGFPFTKIESIPDLDDMQEGTFCGDELWLWLSSWGGGSKVKELISNILLKSRKRGLTIVYTSQSINQVNKRIRDVTDFISYPLISVDDSFCRVEVFRNPAVPESRIKPPLYFNIEAVASMFNTYQEVKPIKEEKSELRELFIPIWENPAWIKYLKERGYTEEEAREKTREIEKAINPDNITSEKQRIKEEETFNIEPD